MACRGCVAPDTVQWVRTASSALPRAPVAAAFVHIPLPEFVQAWNSGVSRGGKGETTCCPACNTRASAALRCVARCQIVHALVCSRNNLGLATYLATTFVDLTCCPVRNTHAYADVRCCWLQGSHGVLGHDHAVMLKGRAVPQCEALCCGVRENADMVMGDDEDGMLRMQAGGGGRHFQWPRP